MSQEKKGAFSDSVLNRGVKIAGEALLTPGSSLLVDGQFKKGLAHVGGGLVAGLVLGPIGPLLVAANSYCQSVGGRNLVETFTKPNDLRDQPLSNKVAAAVDEGVPLEDLQQDIAEDVEDLYAERSHQNEGADAVN
ncbi:DUF6072 family protein [Acanthopleuribacter pedis]|uniref:Uncharacterized protein n=1 Tax=Acanthopleuribacter pedis TaxID=442870 RepID=A0A8J7QDQ8_9BACT|nr:DUF6072 family protein [Acanthopleuribacter pedis]MBO1317735.1 hypothetical protein [Acanthopleuribacter pedis]